MSNVHLLSDRELLLNSYTRSCRYHDHSALLASERSDVSGRDCNILILVVKYVRPHKELGLVANILPFLLAKSTSLSIREILVPARTGLEAVTMIHSNKRPRQT